MTLTVFQAGNSRAVAIPKPLADKLGFEVGVKVEPYLVDHSIAYRPVKIAKGIVVGESLQTWFSSFKKRYSPALTELANK